MRTRYEASQILMQTHNAYYCEQHYEQHIADRKLHKTVAINSALTQPEFEQLQTEVMKRIDALKHIKQQVASKKHIS
jgi:hypothetical protein